MSEYLVCDKCGYLHSAPPHIAKCPNCSSEALWLFASLSNAIQSSLDIKAKVTR